MMGSMRLIMMLPFKSLSYENRRQHRKDEGLQECYQHFDHVNEYGKANRKRGCAPTRTGVQFPGNEYQ